MPSAEDHERRRTEATHKYLRGELNEEQYATERRAHDVDYLAALTALVRFQRSTPRPAEVSEG
jgi:hypothetical protein